ncbi:unnamed protein product [Didymodactylos carnosus]|uniref:dTMP kinase n=1 Tax=Didymodactylos carnosus TaxID=1234261 RepID=A0A8S2CN85_9BILA|nr:unnamed protein product [Didymodactylos carnosus]CAF3499445.1 unnamed protein product [Didymodactylos carnosus]
MQQAKQMQAKLEAEMNAFDQQEFSFGTGSPVQLKLKGDLTVLSLDIDDELLAPSEKPLLQDLLTVTLNEAISKQRCIEQLSHHEFLFTREPGGTNALAAERIRKILLDPKYGPIEPMTEALLYAASRAHHLESTVIPALNNNVTVITDRYVDSSLAYQGHARGLGIETVMQLNMIATQGIMPDLTLFLMLPPKVGMERILSNQEREFNRLDQESAKFHELVHEGYVTIAREYPERIREIDASLPLEQVVEKAFEMITTFIAE